MPRSVSSALAVSSHTDASPDGDPAGGLARLLDGALLRSDRRDPQEVRRHGLDFATQNYLGLAGHPAVRAAALAALDQPGPATPKTSSRPDSPAPVVALEARIATLVQLPAAQTFASGTDAIRQTLAAVLNPGDEVLVDSGAPSAMFETVLARKAGLHRFPSGSVEAVERRLVRLARQPRRGRLVIAVAAVSAHGSRIADLAELASLARSVGAILIADVSHDLGAMGQDGGGVMEIQGCLGRVDIVVGSFAKGFGTGGGFAAFRNPDLAQGVRRGLQPSRTLSPLSASALLAAVEIVASPEGRRRRRNLHGVALRLRNHLMADDARVMGNASPLVPILLPPQTALSRTALLESAGPHVTLLQAPRVPLHAPRWRIELNAQHGPADIDDLAELIRDVSRAFDRSPARLRVAV